MSLMCQNAVIHKIKLSIDYLMKKKIQAARLVSAAADGCTYPGIASRHREDSHEGAIVGTEIIRGNVAVEVDAQNCICGRSWQCIDLITQLL